MRTLSGLMAVAISAYIATMAVTAWAQVPSPPRPIGPPAEVALVFTTLLSELFSVSVVNCRQYEANGVNTMEYDCNGWHHTVLVTGQPDGATVMTIYKERVRP